LPQGFNYSSGDNKQWSTEDELKKMMEEL